MKTDNIQAFKNDNIYTMKTSSTLENDNIQEFKKGNIYSMKNWKMITSSTLEMITSRHSKMKTFTPYKMITSSTLKKYYIQAF